MTFINRYVKSDAFNYYYSEQFNEYGATFIFSVGKTENVGLITKVDESGNVIWEKFLSFGGGTLECKKIIQVEVLNIKGQDTFYVLNAVIDGKHSVIGIESNSGSILWVRGLEWDDKDTQCEIISSRDEIGFYVSISSKSKLDYKTNPILLKFDYYGELTHKIKIHPEKPFLVSSIDSDINGIVIGGILVTENIQGILVRFTKELKFKHSILIEDIESFIHNIKIFDSNSYIISGYSIKDDNLFISKIKYGENSSKYFILDKTLNCNSNIEINGNSIYYTHYNEQDGFVHKLDSFFNVIWTKTLEFPSNIGNGLKLVKQKNNRLTFNCYNEEDGSLLVHCDLSLNTCKTKILDNQVLEIATFKLYDFNFEIDSIEFKTAELELYASDISSEKIEFCKGPDKGGVLFLSDSISLQSTNFVLNAAGSTGDDGSSKGVHLRWLFGGILGDNHLPKGNFYINQNFIFNKPNDFVKIYRAPYVPVISTLSFSTSPEVVDPIKRLWVYKLNSKIIYVYFKDFPKYDTVSSQFNPLIDSSGFIAAYGDSLIEMESKKDLFFSVSFEMLSVVSTSKLTTETLSVEKNELLAPKITSSRGKYGPANFNDFKILSENCRGIRFKAIDCLVGKIYFEFYSDFLLQNNELQSWQPIGEYSLSLDDAKVLYELEPFQNTIHGKWPRYNDGECVNIANYIDKWNGLVEENDRNIKYVVSNFLELSTDIDSPNPTGIETISFDLSLVNEDGTTPEPSEDDYTSLPLLDVLNLGALDYHVARMLGLGTLDLSYDAQSGGAYVYISEYFTYGDLEDGLGAREVQHISMSLPTSYKDERLPISVDLKQIVPGIVTSSDEEEPVMMTNPDGYTPDGKYRFVTLEVKEFDEDQLNKPFYWVSDLFNQSEFSFPVYAGLEYKTNNQTEWVKPELNNDSKYQNIFQNDIGSNESIPLMLPEDNDVLYIHKQSLSGDHHYLTYGVNIFSRSTLSENILSIHTLIKPENLLQPPHNINALLVRKESPLLLTSIEEQERIEQISNTDKTLVRLTFDYNSNQELISYLVEDNYIQFSDSDIENEMLLGDPNPIYPDDKEIFAEEIEVFFRNEVPNYVVGKISNAANDLTNNLVSVLTTTSYLLPSASTSTDPSILSPLIPVGKESNYIGGRLIMGDSTYIVHEIDNTGSFPIIKVLKNQQLDDVQIIQDGYFQLVENMQNVISWNNPYNSASINNPSLFKVKIGISDSVYWKLHREVIHVLDEEGNSSRFLEKTRGFWDEAFVEEILEPVQAIENVDGTITYQEEFNGLYKVTFNNLELPQHEQFSSIGNSVEWFRGILRLRTESSHTISGERKSLDVVRIQNIGNGNLELFIFDHNYPGYNAEIEVLNAYDNIKTGTQEVNYYPGYKVYLYDDATLNLTETGVLPVYGEGNKHSIFALRSHDLSVGFTDYFSKFSIPALMFAQELAEPLKPQTPVGASYATRPDFYGKSTYTFTTTFGTNESYKPHGLQFLRTNDDIILNALYKSETVLTIRENLKVFGGNDEIWLKNRWDDFFNFDFYRNAVGISVYYEFPDNEEIKYRFPLPDNEKFIAEINNFIQWHNNTNGSNVDVPIFTESLSLNQIIIPVASGVENDVLLIDFIEQTIKNTFVPLTEIPVLYQYIKPSSYQPIYKKQTIRDINGFMLEPEHADFDISPMAKRVSETTNSIQFTDFTLDGTSKNIYFYSVREVSNQMQLGEMSSFLGPIKLVNTNAPEAPEIKSVIPILENRVLGVRPSVQFEINSYPEEQFIKKVSIYRSFDRLKGQSIKSMDFVKTIDLDTVLINGIYRFSDDFSDLDEIPFGDPIFYRITVSREVEYSEDGIGSIIEYAPSYPSKLLATLVVENLIPDSPILSSFSEPENGGYLDHVSLSWDKMCYNGIYHLYKMNSQGNWVKIHQKQSNDSTIFVHLEQTDLNNANLRVLSDDGNRIYHHFKVITENTSGMFSTKENILTLFNEVTWQEVGGISEMIIGGTFRIR